MQRERKGYTAVPKTVVEVIRRPELLACCPIPLPMHGTAPRIVMGRKWWREVRDAALQSTHYRCAACGEASPRLDCHEVYDVDHLLGRMTYLETVPMCVECHAYCHPGYLDIQVREGVVSRQYQIHVKNRGDEILRVARVRRKQSLPPDLIAEWSDWRLVVGDREFPPAVGSFAEHVERYGGGS